MKQQGLFAFVCVSSLSFAQQRYGLEDFVKLSLENGPSVKIQEQQVNFAEARADFAASKKWFTGNIDAIAAPVPSATGNAMVSRTDWGEWGSFVGTSIELKQPIFTFGALSSGTQAAKMGVEAEKALLEKEKWKLRYEVAELYYGYQLAFELTELGEDIVKKLETAQKSNKSNVDLQIALSELRPKLLEAKYAKEQARLAMAWKTGQNDATKLLWNQSNLELRNFTAQDLEAYKQNLPSHRPEWRALEAEVLAKKELFEVERGLSFPMLFLYAKGQMNWAENRKNNSSGPFAYDPSNAKSGFVGVGLRWDLGFFEASAKRSQSRAEYLKALVNKGYLQQGMHLELQKKLMDLEVKKSAYDSYKATNDFTSLRYKDALVAYGLKSTSGQKLLESMVKYAQVKKSFLESIYKYNLATHDLERTIGSMD